MNNEHRQVINVISVVIKTLSISSLLLHLEFGFTRLGTLRVLFQLFNVTFHRKIVSND